MKNLDLNKLRKEINKEKSTGVLELKLPDQLEAIEDVKKSIDNLSGLLEGQEQYDFDQLKQAIDEVKNLLQTIDFAPLTKSLEESITNVLTLHNSTHKELQNKNNEAISRLTKTIVDNAAFTDGTTRLMPGGYIYDEVAGTALTENDAAAARIDAKRAQIGVIEDATTRGQRAGVDAAGRLATWSGLFPANTALNTYETRITTATTTTPTSSTAYISSIVISIEAGGAGSTVTIRDKQGTPVVLVNALSTTTTGTTPTILDFQTPIKMTSGIDIITASGSAATVDVWISYYQ